MDVFQKRILGAIANWLTAVVSAVLLLFNVAQAAEQPRTLDLSDYRLIFADEFNGDALNSANWRPHNQEGQRKGGYWSTDQASVADGHLTIRTQYRSDGEFGSGWYTCGLSTQGRFENTYGYYECRCKLPRGQGLWSAFWLTCPSVGNVTRTGKTGTEIDVFESPYSYLGGSKANKVTSNLHYNGYGLQTKYKNVVISALDNDPYENFNTYGLLWTEDAYVFYVNGHEVGRSSYGGVSQAKEYMVLSCEADGADAVPTFGWSGNIKKNGRDFTADFVVDYVRVYGQQNDVHSTVRYAYTLDPNGGRLSGSSSTDAFTASADYDTDITAAAPSKTGCTFTGWKLSGENANYDTAKWGSADPSSAISSGTLCVGTTADDAVCFRNLSTTQSADASKVVLTAQWTANKFHVYLRNGNTTNLQDVEVTYNTPNALPAASTLPMTPPVSGAQFAGWHAGDAAAGYSSAHVTDGYGDRADMQTKSTGDDIYLYAVWKRTPAFYFVDTATGEKRSDARSTVQYISGDNTAYAMERPASPGDPDGWTFCRWSASQSATGSEIASPYTGEGSVFYAIYTRTANFYDGTNSTAVTKEQYRNINSTTAEVWSVTPPAMTSLSDNSGWTALGWRYSSGTGEPEIRVTDAAAFDAKKGPDFFAAYSRDVTLMHSKRAGAPFQNAAGTVADSAGTQYYTNGSGVSTVTLPVSSSFYTLAGYTQTGWAATDGGTTDVGASVDFAPEQSSAALTKTVYAIWQANQYTVLYDVDHDSLPVNLLAVPWTEAHTETVGGLTFTYNPASTSDVASPTGSFTLNGSNSAGVNWFKAPLTLEDGAAYVLQFRHVGGTREKSSGRLRLEFLDENDNIVAKVATIPVNRATISDTVDPLKWNGNFDGSATQGLATITIERKTFYPNHNNVDQSACLLFRLTSGASTVRKVRFCTEWENTYTNYEFQILLAKVESGAEDLPTASLPSRTITPYGRIATYDSAMPTVDVPTRAGCTFGGYYTAKNGGGMQVYTETGESAAPCALTADTTLYAKWLPNKFTG